MTRWIAIAALCLGVAHAEPYPAKPVRFIIPFPPGGPTDIVGRLAAERLSRNWNVQVVADNRPGQGGNIGTEQCARAPADGYTMCMISIAQSISPAIYPKLGFDPVRDFAHVTLLATRVTRIVYDATQRIAEDRSRLLEGDAVLGSVARRLLRVPFESHYRAIIAIEPLTCY